MAKRNSAGLRPPPAADSRARLIVAIDYGTSFSGAAYTLYRRRPAEPNVKAVVDWPHQNPFHRASEKVPSDIAYDHEGNYHCGFDIPDGLKRLKWVKLLLEPESERAGLRMAVEVRSTQQYLKELGKSPLEVVSDFLRWLWKTTRERICDRQSDPNLITNAETTVVLTVPAMWSDKARDNTVRAAELAGIDSDGRSIKFLTEPEAAAISELQDRVNSGQIKQGDCVIICDAGGGTVDVVSYQVRNEQPLELDQKVIAQGGLCGSVYIDQEFQKQLNGLLQDDVENLTELAKTEIKERFAWVIKPSYDQTKSGRKYVFQVPGVPDSLERHIRGEKIEISSHVIEVAFESVMSGILCLIDDQEAELKKQGLGQSLKGILLVGGLGESRFLYSRICQNYPPSEGVTVWRGESSWTSVVKGAVRCEYMALGNVHLVNSRLSRWNYGVIYSARFNSDRHREEEKFWCPYQSMFKAKNQISWLVRKGQEINPESPPVSHDFRQIVELSDFRKTRSYITDIGLVRSDEDNAPTYRNSAVTDFVDITCEVSMEVFLESRVRELDSQKGSWKVHFIIEQTMLPALLSFRCLMAGNEVGNCSVSYRDTSVVPEISTPPSGNPQTPQRSPNLQTSTLSTIRVASPSSDGFSEVASTSAANQNHSLTESATSISRTQVTSHNTSPLADRPNALGEVRKLFADIHQNDRQWEEADGELYTAVALRNV